MGRSDDLPGDGVETLINQTEARRLETLFQYEIMDSPPEAAFDDLTNLAAGICHTPISLISFLDGNREWFKSKIGTGLAEIPRDDAFCAHAIRSTDVMVVPDASCDSRFAHNPLVSGEAHIRFYAGCPLFSENGEGLGALCVLDRVPHELTPEQKQLLKRLGHEATMLLNLRRENLKARHHAEMQTAELHRVQEELLLEMSQHRKAEEDLCRRERQLADAQRLAVLGSWEWDLKTDNITWSDELYRMFGVTPGATPSSYEAYLNWLHPEDRACVDELIKNTLRTNGSFIREQRIIRTDGVIRTLHTSGEIIMDGDRRPIRMIGFAQDITGRKEMEQKLQETVSLLHSTLESTADGILVVDTNGRLARYNQRFMEMWDIPKHLVNGNQDAVILSHVLELLDDPQIFLARVRELYASPEEDSFDILKFKDGRTFERYSHPQRCEGKVIGRVWSFRDVTERHQSLEELRKSEERYRSLVTASSQLIWTADPKGGITKENFGWQEFSGQAPEEMEGDGWLERVHPHDREMAKKGWATAVAMQTFYQLEFRVRRFDNVWRHLLHRAVPIFEKDGKVREWIGASLDITERRQAEQIVLDERDFSNAVISSLPGTFYLVDQRGRLLGWNKNLEEVTGYTADELRGIAMEQLVAPEYLSAATEQLRRTLSEGSGEIELDLLTKKQTKYPCFCTARMVQREGEPCIVGIAMDISERKRIEKEIKDLNQDLEKRVHERTMQLHASNKDLQSFSYTISHDLKAPLRSITGFAEAIRDDCNDQLDQEHRSYLQRILNSADRMARLIEDLLTYSRIGRSAIYLHPLSLKDLLLPIVEEFRFMVLKTGGNITVAPDLPIVHADRSLLAQAVTNLIENALKYRKPDIPLQVCIEAREEVDHVVLCVTDNGIGIAPQHHQRIFEVFQRLHRAEEYPGTGIGLANVRKAVELQGGSVWVESEINKGSTFCIKLKRNCSEGHSIAPANG